MPTEHACRSLVDYLVLLAFCLAVMGLAEHQRETLRTAPAANVFASAQIH